MVGNIPTLRHLLVKLYTLHRGASFHSNLRNSHNDNHYADIEDLNGRCHLDGEDTAYPGGVWVLECQTLSLNFIFRTSERPYTMNIATKNSSKQHRESQRVCQNRSGSKDHADPKTPKKIKELNSTCLLFFTKKNIKIGSRSSEKGVSKSSHSPGRGPPLGPPEHTSPTSNGNSHVKESIGAVSGAFRAD